MMKTIKWYIMLDGIKEEDEFEVENDTPDNEIEAMAKEAAFNYIDWGWEKAGDR